MQKTQAQNIVKETLQNDFDKERFLYFVKNLLNKVDDTKAFHVHGYVPEAYKSYVKTYERLATYTDPVGGKIDILVVYLQKEISLERARTAQRNFVARYLKDRDQKDAGLIAFVSPNPADWRFSLVKMEYKFTEGKSGKTKVKEEFTPAKRWSFLVGKNENSHTAQSRLAPIVEDDQTNPTLKQLEDAFNIEKVTKEFFEKYRELFLRVYETLGDVIKQHPDIKADFAEKNINTVDFSKKLLGQIVFLYFLQKKGWFGVPMNKGWGNGDKKFLRTLFEEAASKDKNYFNDYLEPLFYEALAKERDDDFYSRFECKIPFLNGGLFDPINNYDWVNTAIDLPNDIFSNIRKTKDGDTGDGILDIFDRYNFTVKEDEPLEKEVAIDPEMLGKVFENLLEVKDRKSKGTYYTPREIVHYMCEQSLLNYLATELESKVSKEDLEKLIKIGENVVEHEAIHVAKKENDPNYKGLYDQILPASIEKFAKEIDEKLAIIKVCDPAIGSGAFPVGMMNAIVKARMVLSSYLKDKNRTLYAFKRDCIQNSLYGVDIDPGAVEIAKLRLWLSLVVDEDDIKQIKPLPNLDYKIMQGNSLLEEYEGIKLFDEKLLSKTSKQELVDKINQIEILVKENDSQRLKFYEKNPQWMKNKKIEKPSELLTLENTQKVLETKKATLIHDLKNLELTKQQDELSLYQKSRAKSLGEDIKRLHKEFFEATQKSNKDNVKKQIEQLEWELIEATLKEQNKISALKKLEEFKRSNTKPFFLWKLNFAVEDKGGFDVVIANPPYISYGLRGGQKITTQEKETLRKAFPNSAEYKISMYALFMDKAIQLARDNGGVQTFIVPDSFLLGRYFSKIRSFILENNKIQNILLLPYGVFDATVGFSVVYCFQKVFNNLEHLIASKFAVDNEQVANGSYKQFIYPQSYFEHTKYNRFRLFFEKKTMDLVIKIETDTQELINYMHGHTGVRSLIGQKNIVAKLSDGKTWNKGLISGSQVLKYRVSYEDDYINIDPKLLNKGGWDYDIIHNPKILLRQTGDHLTAAVDFNGYYHLNNIHTFSLINNKLDILFVLAVLNSHLFDFYYKAISLEAGRAMAQTDIETIESLPIREATEQQQKAFVDLVERILKITEAGDYLEHTEKQAKVRDIELQIDELVYKLYDLTDEEIKIVETN